MKKIERCSPEGCPLCNEELARQTEWQFPELFTCCACNNRIDQDNKGINPYQCKACDMEQAYNEYQAGCTCF